MADSYYSNYGLHGEGDEEGGEDWTQGFQQQGFQPDHNLQSWRAHQAQSSFAQIQNPYSQAQQFVSPTQPGFVQQRPQQLHSQQQSSHLAQPHMFQAQQMHAQHLQARQLQDQQQLLQQQRAQQATWASNPQYIGLQASQQRSYPSPTQTNPIQYSRIGQHGSVAGMNYLGTSLYPPGSAMAGPSSNSSEPAPVDRESDERLQARRSTSFLSNESSAAEQSDVSRSASPSLSELAAWGRRNTDGTWSCSFPGCNSRSTFTRGCDLRKHYKRHSKIYFCRVEGCPQASEGGFSSKKDRLRHEAKHNPSIPCEVQDCPRLFSRVDNMKDHVRRMHTRRST